MGLDSCRELLRKDDAKEARAFKLMLARDVEEQLMVSTSSSTGLQKLLNFGSRNFLQERRPKEWHDGV